MNREIKIKIEKAEREEIEREAIKNLEANNKYLIFMDDSDLTYPQKILKEYELYKVVQYNLYSVYKFLGIMIGTEVNKFKDYDEFKRYYKDICWDDYYYDDDTIF